MFRRTLQSLAPRLFALATLALAFWVGYVAYKGLDRNRKIEQEVASLQAEAQKIEKDNKTLRERIGYFQTDNFQEEEAKQKLNYQNPDEKVVVVKSSTALSSENDSSVRPSTPSVPEDLRPNYEKWWSRFFE